MQARYKRHSHLNTKKTLQEISSSIRLIFVLIGVYNARESTIIKYIP